MKSDDLRDAWLQWEQAGRKSRRQDSRLYLLMPDEKLNLVYLRFRIAVPSIKFYIRLWFYKSETGEICLALSSTGDIKGIVRAAIPAAPSTKYVEIVTVFGFLQIIDSVNIELEYIDKEISVSFPSLSTSDFRLLTQSSKQLKSGSVVRSGVPLLSLFYVLRDYCDAPNDVYIFGSDLCYDLMTAWSRMIYQTISTCVDLDVANEITGTTVTPVSFSMHIIAPAPMYSTVVLIKRQFFNSNANLFAVIGYEKHVGEPISQRVRMYGESTIISDFIRSRPAATAFVSVYRVSHLTQRDYCNQEYMPVVNFDSSISVSTAYISGFERSSFLTRRTFTG